jgi:hypothetical protein
MTDASAAPPTTEPVIRPRRSLRRAAAPLLLAALLSGAGGIGVAGPAPATAASGPSGVTAIARRQYSLEIHGGAAFAALHRVGRDATLLRLVRSGDATATRAYVAREFAAVWYHLHVSRVRVLQGARTVADAGVPFTVAPVQMALHGAGGRVAGTLQVAIQDEIGFVRFMHRNYGVDVVVRGRVPGHVRTSLPAAASVSLPAAGSVRIAGQRYRVSSFHDHAWNGEPVTVSILQRG